MYKPRHISGEDAHIYICHNVWPQTKRCQFELSQQSEPYLNAVRLKLACA